MTTRKLQYCAHCERITSRLRSAGGLIGAEPEHFLMAAVEILRGGGASLADVLEATRMIWAAEPSGAPTMGPPIRAQDVSVVASVPSNAIDAFVAAQGERPA